MNVVIKPFGGIDVLRMERGSDKINVCWDITSRCNEQCRFCFRDSCAKELSLAENLLIFKNLVDMGAVKISFTGGEPLLYEKLFELASLGREYSALIELSLITNGILLARWDEEKSAFIPNIDFINKIAKHFNGITFSLDAPNAETESKMTRNQKHFDRIMFLIDYISDNYPKLYIKINTLVSKINLYEINDLFELLKKKDIKRWKLFYFIASRGTAVFNKKQFHISEEKFKEICNGLKIHSKPGMKVTFNSFRDFLDAYFHVSSDGFLIKYDGRTYERFLDCRKNLKTILSSDADSLCNIENS